MVFDYIKKDLEQEMPGVTMVLSQVKDNQAFFSYGARTRFLVELVESEDDTELNCKVRFEKYCDPKFVFVITETLLVYFTRVIIQENYEVRDGKVIADQYDEEMPSEGDKIN